MEGTQTLATDGDMFLAELPPRERAATRRRAAVATATASTRATLKRARANSPPTLPPPETTSSLDSDGVTKGSPSSRGSVSPQAVTATTRQRGGRAATTRSRRGRATAGLSRLTGAASTTAGERVHSPRGFDEAFVETQAPAMTASAPALAATRTRASTRTPPRASHHYNPEPLSHDVRGGEDGGGGCGDGAMRLIGEPDDDDDDGDEELTLILGLPRELAVTAAGLGSGSAAAPHAPLRARPPARHGSHRPAAAGEVDDVSAGIARHSPGGPDLAQTLAVQDLSLRPGEETVESVSPQVALLGESPAPRMDTSAALAEAAASGGGGGRAPSPAASLDETVDDGCHGTNSSNQADGEVPLFPSHRLGPRTPRVAPRPAPGRPAPPRAELPSGRVVVSPTFRHTTHAEVPRERDGRPRPPPPLPALAMAALSTDVTELAARRGGLSTPVDSQQPLLLAGVSPDARPVPSVPVPPSTAEVAVGKREAEGRPHCSRSSACSRGDRVAGGEHSLHEQGVHLRGPHSTSGLAHRGGLASSGLPAPVSYLSVAVGEDYYVRIPAAVGLAGGGADSAEGEGAHHRRLCRDDGHAAVAPLVVLGRVLELRQTASPSPAEEGGGEGEGFGGPGVRRIAPADLYVIVQLYEVTHVTLFQNPRTGEVGERSTVRLSSRWVCVHVDALIFDTPVFVVRTAGLRHVYELEGEDTGVEPQWEEAESSWSPALGTDEAPPLEHLNAADETGADHVDDHGELGRGMGSRGEGSGRWSGCSSARSPHRRTAAPPRSTPTAPRHDSAGMALPDAAVTREGEGETLSGAGVHVDALSLSPAQGSTAPLLRPPVPHPRDGGTVAETVARDGRTRIRAGMVIAYRGAYPYGSATASGATTPPPRGGQTDGALSASTAEDTNGVRYGEVQMLRRVSGGAVVVVVHTMASNSVFGGSKMEIVTPDMILGVAEAT